MDTVLARRQSGQVSCSGGRADGIVRIGVGEANPLACHAIDVRRLEIGIAVTTQLPGTLVVGENEDDVRLLGNGLNGEGAASGEQRKKGAD